MQYLKKFISMLWAILPHATLIFIGVFLWWYLNTTTTSSMPVISSIASGIISGLVTAFMLFVFAILWKKNITPWFENLLYQDVCIEGEWSGILIPYLGLEDIDEIAKKAAWNRYLRRIREEQKKERGEAIPASSIDDNGEGKEVSAELILHNDSVDSESKPQDYEKHIKISIGAVPIVIRVEIERIGHKITGRIIEIGGASKVHTYNISGSFKNLILSGCYDTCSRDHIDRGAMSLMLKNNGKEFEGFFSSYTDHKNKIAPMQYIIKKKNQLADDENGI